jgi:hypothetical protein
MKRKMHIQTRVAVQSSFEKYGPKSKQEQFLDEMNKGVPWTRLLALGDPNDSKAGNGRRPVGLEVMFRAVLTSSSSGFTCLSLAVRMRPMIRPGCGALLGVTWVWQRRRIRRRSLASASHW